MKALGISNHKNLIFQAKRMYCKRMNIGYTGYIDRGKFSVNFGNMDHIYWSFCLSVGGDGYRV